MASVQERYQLLLDDPDLSKVEAHRVFCSRCSKWLKLDETKLYAASVWRCHKNTKTHNAKAPTSSASAPPPAGNADSQSTINQKPGASSALLPGSKEHREGSSAGASSRHRVSAHDAEPRSKDPPLPVGVQPAIPRLKIRVPAPSRNDNAPAPTPSSGGTRTISQAKAVEKSPIDGPNQGSNLALNKPRPSSTLSQALTSSQLASSKADVPPVSMPPPVSLLSKRKNSGLPAKQPVHTASTTPGTNSNQNTVPGSSSSKEKDPSSAGASTPQLPLPPGLLPERQASYYALKAEPFIQLLEPYRAFCSLCRCWVELSSRTQYSYGVWKGHVRKSEKHVRLQIGQAENDYETASDHSQDESGLRSTSDVANVAENSAGTKRVNGGTAPMIPVSRGLPAGATPASTIQEANGRASHDADPTDEDLLHPTAATPSGGKQSTSALNGGSPLSASENPFALKATTENSFGPRHVTAAGGPGEVSLLEGDMPALTESSDEEPTPNTPRRRLSPAKARQKRRDAMLADPDAAIVESRRVQCRMCERWIKGSNTQEYSSHHWLKHKNKCARSQARENDRWSETAETRKQKLDADPDVEILEAHRALCRLCHKWVKLCSRSRYSASHWLQHKKKCPATHGPGSSMAPTELAESIDVPAAAESDEDEKERVPNWDSEARRSAFLTDPDVLELRPDRVQCKICNRWIKLSSSLEYKNVNWLLHKECCTGTTADSTGKQQHALEARKKALEEDPDVAEFEPHRVQCAVCKSWVKLRHDCSYSLGKWLLHRRRCGQQTRELLTSHSSNSGDAAITTKVESCADDDEDDAREAMDVENWLKDELDENGDSASGPLPAGCSYGDQPCLQCGQVHTVGNVDGDGDVEMNGIGEHSNSHPPATHVDADDEADGKVTGGSALPSLIVSTQQAPDLNAASELNVPPKDADRRENAVGHHPQASSGRRRGRGKAVSRPIRPLPKGKGKAAAFMRGQSSSMLPPIPARPRWPDEDERKQQFVSDPDVLKIEPHRLLCKNCNCWIRLHPLIRYSQSVWPRHKESCKGTQPVVAPGDAKSRAKSEKEDARQRLLDEDPYATDVSPHRVTCKACGTNIRLDTTYKYEGSHWRAHRARCTRIPVHDRLSKKRKATEQVVHEPAAAANSSDEDDSDASSAPRPRPTSFFTAPLIIKPTEMFKRRSHALVPSPSKVAAAAAVKAQRDAELAAELAHVAAQLEKEGRFMTILQSCGDGITSEERLVQAQVDEQAEDVYDDSQNENGREVQGQSPTPDSESWVPRKRTREEDEAFDAFFSRRPLPPTPPRPKSRSRTCKLGKEAMHVVD